MKLRRKCGYMKRLMGIFLIILSLLVSCSQPNQPVETKDINSPALEATIEVSTASQGWKDLAEAIEFFKTITEKRIGADMAAVEFSPEYYNEAGWAIVENEGNRMLATYEIQPGQLEHREFLQGNDYSEIIYYSAQKPYPEQIILRWKVRNSDLMTVEVARDIPFDPFTEEFAVKYLKDMFFWGDEVESSKVELATDISGNKYYQILGAPDFSKIRDTGDKSGVWYVFDNGSIQTSLK